MRATDTSRLRLVALLVCVAACGSKAATPDGGVAAAPGVAAAAPATTGAPAAPGAKVATTGGHKVLQVRFDRITVKRGGDKGLVKRGVRPHMPEVRACYQNGLGRNANLHGQVEVALAIRKGGRVAAARVRSSNLQDRATANCIARAARRWSFRGATKRVDAVVRFKLFRG